MKLPDKSCFVCGTEENLCNRPNSTYKGRSYWFCRECKSDRVKKYYDKKRELVFSEYGEVCFCCREVEQKFLSIDHVNNDGNLDRWPSGSRVVGVQLYSRIVKEGFPKKYQLLCMNCNFGKRMNGGVCPHNDSV